LLLFVFRRNVKRINAHFPKSLNLHEHVFLDTSLYLEEKGEITPYPEEWTYKARSPASSSSHFIASLHCRSLEWKLAVDPIDFFVGPRLSAKSHCTITFKSEKRNQQPKFV